MVDKFMEGRPSHSPFFPPLPTCPVRYITIKLYYLSTCPAHLAYVMPVERSKPHPPKKRKKKQTPKQAISFPSRAGAYSTQSLTSPHTLTRRCTFLLTLLFIPSYTCFPLTGYNVTIMAYGQTSSGKTYTMGTGAPSAEDRGSTSEGKRSMHGLAVHMKGIQKEISFPEHPSVLNSRRHFLPPLSPPPFLFLPIFASSVALHQQPLIIPQPYKTNNRHVLPNLIDQVSFQEP